MAGSKNFKAIRTGATASIFTSTSMATMELGLERVTRLDGLDSLPSSLNKAARQRELAKPKSRRQTGLWTYLQQAAGGSQVSSTEKFSVSHMMTDRSITFSSSRMFPGQGYD